MENEKFEFKDDFIASIAKNTKRATLPNSFDLELMHAIRESHECKKEVSSKLKTSMQYVFMAMFLIVVYILFIIISKSFINETINLFSIIALFFSIGISVVFTFNYRRLISQSL